MTAPVTATVSGKRAKWAFNVLAYVATPQGNKVEVFDDYTFASRWTQSLGGGVVYPRNMIADYTTSGVTLKEGMALHQAEVEPTQLDLF